MKHSYCSSLFMIIKNNILIESLVIKNSEHIFVLSPLLESYAKQVFCLLNSQKKRLKDRSYDSIAFVCGLFLLFFTPPNACFTAESKLLDFNKLSNFHYECIDR